MDHSTIKRTLAAGVTVLSLLVLSPSTYAVPMEIRDPGVAQSLPEDFVEIPATNIAAEAFARQVFMRRGSNDISPPTWFSIRRVPGTRTNELPGLWRESPDEFKVVGRFSERLYNLDADILESEMQTNAFILRRRSVQLPAGPDVFMLDLQSPSLKTNEMEAIMRKVVKTIAEQNSATERVEVQGWQSAIVCLLMVAMVFVVALARR
jgi:hypothetical protein